MYQDFVAPYAVGANYWEVKDADQLEVWRCPSMEEGNGFTWAPDDHTVHSSYGWNVFVSRGGVETGYPAGLMKKAAGTIWGGDQGYRMPDRDGGFSGNGNWYFGSYSVTTYTSGKMGFCGHLGTPANQHRKFGFPALNYRGLEYAAGFLAYDYDTTIHTPKAAFSMCDGHVEVLDGGDPDLTYVGMWEAPTSIVPKPAGWPANADCEEATYYWTLD